MLFAKKSVSNYNSQSGDNAVKPVAIAVPSIQTKRGLSKTRLKWLTGLSLGVGLAIMVGLAELATEMHYGPIDLIDISLMTETVEGHQWVGDGISFEQRQGNQFDVVFSFSDRTHSAQLVLQDIDLSLFIPTAPETAWDNPTLTRWFLTEREFNRQRVLFDARSEQIQLSQEFAGYRVEDLAISLTNNCLQAGYWELAVFVQTESGDSEKIYQGYFTFPKDAYASLVSQLNPTRYWRQARNMEAWPGFRFLSGMAFDLDALRQVNRSQAVPITDLASEPIIATDEQVKKVDLMVYADDISADAIETWADLRQAKLKFHSFTPPGSYDSDRLWQSDFSQLAKVKGATAREISSPLSNQPLLEVEIEFASAKGESRKFVISGFDLEQIPPLDSSDYSNGVYMPLGFGAPFTQTYSELAQNPPNQSAFFSVWLDGANRLIDYRKDIGLNGLALHRDADNERLLHVYILSYERITLAGHYVIDLAAVVNGL